MEKALVFSHEQKSLILSRFVGPNGGTQEEARHFVEVCETFGLNPLLGDIVFQKYHTRQGSRAHFITTRDGLLRIAAQHPDYVGAPCAAEVREGDKFEFIPSESNVRHVFGQKRGNIIGAYAIMYHKRFRPCAVFINFIEYFKANARSQRKNGQGGSLLWDAMPSAMIIKVAEAFVLRRQFPLGGFIQPRKWGWKSLKANRQILFRTIKRVLKIIRLILDSPLTIKRRKKNCRQMKNQKAAQKKKVSRTLLKKQNQKALF